MDFMMSIRIWYHACISTPITSVPSFGNISSPCLHQELKWVLFYIGAVCFAAHVPRLSEGRRRSASYRCSCHLALVPARLTA